MNKTCFLPSLLATTALMLAALSPAVGQEFRAGAATSNITPPLGKDIIGGFQPYPSKHIHDELHARCLALDDGKTRLALVVCDLLGIHRNVSDQARKLIQEGTGIPPERVLISATHTHSASSALGQDRFKHDQEVDDYQQFVARRIADGVRCAVNRLRPADIGFGTAQAPEHVFNRRWTMKPGTMPLNPFGELDQVKMNPPAGSPNLLEPAGPTDPTISFLSVRGTDGKPISIYAAYSLHYVGGVADADISADYFGMFCSQLDRLLKTDNQDPPFVALLANGTSGDINNINFRTPRPRQDAYVQMRFVAEDVAKTVHEALAKVEYQKKVTLDARYRELPVAWRKPTPQQAAWAKATLDKGPAAGGKTDLAYIYAERTMRLAEYPETAKVPLQVLRIGDVCLGTMPCEVFCEIGLDFKSRSPFPKSFLVSLGHGYLGYLPTPRQHRLGGYETWIGTNRLEPNASDKMLESLLEMAGEVKSSLPKP